MTEPFCRTCNDEGAMECDGDCCLYSPLPMVAPCPDCDGALGGAA